MTDSPAFDSRTATAAATHLEATMAASETTLDTATLDAVEPRSNEVPIG